MKHWCYYARVVSCLERIEARQAKNTPTGAYLVWRDEDGSPWMVAGPDIDWFRGDGPVPDIVGLRPSVKDRSMPKTESRTQQPSAQQAEPSTQVTARHMTKGQQVMTRQQVTGQQSMTGHQVTETTCISQPKRHVTSRCGHKQANKRRTHFLKTAQIRSNPLKPPHPAARNRAVDGSPRSLVRPSRYRAIASHANQVARLPPALTSRL